MLAQVSRECGGQKCNGSIPNIKIKRACLIKQKERVTFLNGVQGLSGMPRRMPQHDRLGDIATDF